MPHGELLIRTHKATVGRNTDGYVDAYDRYGLSLDNGAVSQLLVPVPNKEPVGNSSVIKAGVSYLGGSVNVKNEHTLSLEAHIYAASKADFLLNLDRFNREVIDLDSGEFIRLKIASRPKRVYRVLYQNFQQFSTFNTEMAQFIWTLKEPHPELRDVAAPLRTDVVAVVEKDSDLANDDTLYNFYDLAVVTNPESGHEANNKLRVFDGSVWDEGQEVEVSNGDFCKNTTDGNYWRYDKPGTAAGTWKKYWY